MTPQTPYERLGGEAGVRKLVHRFYELMDELPEAYQVRKLHPDSLAGSEQNLFEYLSGWFGGPTMYTDKKGHPRMRQRHAPYAVTLEAKDEWMLCMKQSLAETVADEPFRTQLQANFQALADHMVNTQ
ncbi:MAG: group II truncated hemoglobin [Polaromonas sp.]|jgi:hemoglobin|nr:group II truncated hemoglobin [Polaromonas sp.]MBP6088894.1 group II truncated hemoglobin [Polaromonas sp.]MBP6155431.1 group II truncated hemoglobin [Polaromonas sp.]MBP7114933.1 group II truncated hemoglobin [Polaromonas sp.]